MEYPGCFIILVGERSVWIFHIHLMLLLIGDIKVEATVVLNHDAHS